MRFSGRVLLLVMPAILAACSDTPTTPTRPQPQPNPSPNPTLMITCPSNVTASTPEGTQVAVSFPPATATGGVVPVEISCARQSGSMFAAGTTAVRCSATDSAGQTASCSFDVTVTAIPPRLTKTRFLAFGDSMTAGEVVASALTRRGSNARFVIDPSSAYPTKLAAALRARYTSQASAIDVVNGGRSGEWAEDGARRLEQVLQVSRPEVLILLEGTNDLAGLSQRGVTSASSALERMAKEGRGRGAMVMLATLPPPAPRGDHAVSDSLIRDLNGRIRNIAAGEGAVLVDLYTGMINDVSRYIGVDGLHPTAAGYERIAELMLLAIRSNFESRTP